MTSLPRSRRAFRLAPLAVLVGTWIGTAASASERLVVHPAEIRFGPTEWRQQVAVTLVDHAGASRDVTATTSFAVDRNEVAAVTPAGVVTPRSAGSATLQIKNGSLSLATPILIMEAPRPQPASYRRDVAPVLSKAGCNMGACHGNLNGKGGFRLSLRGEDPGFDLAMMTRDAAGRRLDGQNPAASLALLKPTGQVVHEGGVRINLSSPEYASMAEWIGSGAHDDVDSTPQLARLTVFPSESYLSPQTGRQPGQQLVVTAEFRDGSRRDVTRQAAYDLNDPTRATVSADGRVEANGPGEIVVAVRYLDGRGVSRLAFLPDRPDFVAESAPATEPIDAAILSKLNALKIQPSPPVPDAVFLRRAFLDALGLPPSADEARAFLADSDPEKRAKLVDALVARPEFADFWALKWADLLRNEEKTMGSKGVWAVHRWLRDQIAADVPMTQFARELVSGLGSTWENPPASFHRTNRDPMAAAETIGQVFLGVRLQCARCHNHPFDAWTQDDYYGLAAFFSNVRRREVDNKRADDLDKHEINGDEIVYLSGSPGMIQPRSGRKLSPKPPGGPAPDLQGNPAALDALAVWLTTDNPQFARNLANRVWFHLLGRGVVEPVDDFRDSNPASNPALLEALTSSFVADGLRLKPLVARIMKSRAYQFGSTPNPTNLGDEANFARYPVKLLPAEVLLDALGSALDRPERFKEAPSQTRAVQLPGARMGGDFLKAFGKPDRLLTCECERSETTTLAQAFQLINGEAVRRKLKADDNRLGRLIRAGTEPAAILAELYLATVSRPPTDAEARIHLAHVARGEDARKAWEDVAWSLLNSKEFLLRH